MNITPHFTLEEFTSTAHRGIDNTLPGGLMPSALETCQMMERIRACLNVPILVTSGYRCLALNRVIGSSDSSDHVLAKAIDFKAPSFGTPYEIATELAKHMSDLAIGQLIHEFSSWVHVSTKFPAKAVNRIITIDNTGTRVGVVK